MDRRSCPQCGLEDFGVVLSEDETGDKKFRRYCRECQRRAQEEARNEVRRLAAGAARLLIYGGVVLALLTATADYLAISGRMGFGWRQLTGVELSLIAIVLGVVLRKGLLGVSGLFLLVLSLGADLLQVGRMPGFGWRSHLGFVVATAMLVAGILWRRALTRRSQLVGHE